MTTDTLRILIADDHEAIVSGILSFLHEKIPAGHFQGVNALPELHAQLNQGSFDVLLQDIRFGSHDAREFLKDIIQTTPGMRVIALSSHQDLITVKSTLALGCSGYISKNAPLEELWKAIQEVIQDRRYISNDIQQVLWQDTSGISREHIELTSRELEVLKGIQDELSTKEIADKLHLSEKTIEGYRSSLFLKFDVKNVAGLVKKSILKGYL